MLYSIDYRKRIFDVYASRSSEYDQTFDHHAASKWGKAYDYYFRHWLPVNKSAQILDIACGGGRLLHFFKERGYVNLTGVDISLEQVSLSKQVTNSVYEGNLLDFLRKTSHKFDLVVGLDIIEHLYKKEIIEFLDLCFEVLNDEGRLILSTPNADSPFSGAVRYGDFTHENLFNYKSLSWLVELSGFEQGVARELNPVPFNYSLKSTMRFVLWNILRSVVYAWNIIETGRPGSKIYTRNFIFSVLKPKINK